MRMDDASDITQLLERVSEGDQAAWNELLPRIYATLLEIAHRLMADQKPGHTLQTTALVHEAFLKLAGSDSRWETRRQFERIAAQAMRSVLVDHARSRQTLKRGEGWRRVLLTEEVAEVTGPRFDVLALDEALESLHELDPETAEIAELRCFAGLEHAEIAKVTGRSKRTVERAWRFARSWLEREMEEGGDE